MHNHAITIANTTIHQDEHGCYLLNDLHRASGGNNKTRPKYWLENQKTQELIAVMTKGGNPPIQVKQGLGTFVCREMVYAYATWISPVFFLKVIRAYDALVTANPPAHHQQLALATQVGQLTDMVRSRDAIITAKDGIIMGLQDRLIGSQGRQIRLIGQVASMQKRQRDREIIQLIERMEIEGKPRSDIAAMTGKPSNYIRQRLLIARREGRITTPQGELNLGGAA